MMIPVESANDISYQYLTNNPTTLTLNPCTLSNGSNTSNNSNSTITSNVINHQNVINQRQHYQQQQQQQLQNNSLANNFQNNLNSMYDYKNNNIALNQLQMINNNAYIRPCNNKNCSHLSHMSPLSFQNQNQQQSVYDYNITNDCQYTNNNGELIVSQQINNFGQLNQMNQISQLNELNETNAQSE
eukprot:715613_1